MADAKSDKMRPKMNMRGNKTRKKAPAAFWDKVLKTDCATTAEKKTIKPMIAA